MCICILTAGKLESYGDADGDDDLHVVFVNLYPTNWYRRDHDLRECTYRIQHSAG
eukprot:m.81078 g.81078  ORF g.81078 m.81078 type:complete len:55 (+) comp19433_c0_seq1:3823-3987(+)